MKWCQDQHMFSMHDTVQCSGAILVSEPLSKEGRGLSAC